MVLVGANLTVNVEGNTVQGAGDTTVTAQNGIEVGYGANGVIDGNTVNGIAYTGSLNWAQLASWSAPAASPTISNNTVTNSQMAIDVDTTATITGNTITGEDGNDWGIVAYANETITNNTISDVGGAIFIMAGDSTTSTITGNTLSGYAGVSGKVGLWTYDIPSSATVTLGGNSYARISSTPSIKTCRQWPWTPPATHSTLAGYKCLPARPRSAISLPSTTRSSMPLTPPAWGSSARRQTMFTLTRTAMTIPITNRPNTAPHPTSNSP